MIVLAIATAGHNLKAAAEAEAKAEARNLVFRRYVTRTKRLTCRGGVTAEACLLRTCSEAALEMEPGAGDNPPPMWRGV